MKLQHAAAVAHAVKLICLLLMLVLMLVPSVSMYTVETEGENLSPLAYFIKPVNEDSEEYKENENAFVLNVPQLALQMWELADDYEKMGEEMDQISPPPVTENGEAVNPEELSDEEAQFHEDMKFNRMMMVTAQVLCRVVSILMYAAFVLLCIEILLSVAHLLFTLHPALVWVKKKSPIFTFFFAGGFGITYVVCILFQFCILGPQNATLNTLEATQRVQLVFRGWHFALVWIIAFAAYAVLAVILRKVSASKTKNDLQKVEKEAPATDEMPAVAEEANA